MKKTGDDSEESPNSWDQINGIGFMVNERPVAVYGRFLRERTHRFIKEFDADYWGYQLSLATSVPIEEVTHDHVAFVRLTLSHVEEHLFALIFAFLQAPYCPDLWLYHYKPSDLPKMARKVELGERVLTRFKLAESSWIGITKTLWGGLEEERYTLTARVLGRLARHFISTHGRDEYNGLKHGMRLSFGGTSLSFSPGGSPDVKPDPDSYISLGSSKFGSQFYDFEPMSGSKNHYRAKVCFTNWDYMELGAHLTHAIMLINNMGAAFRNFANIEGDHEFCFFRGDAAYTDDPRKIEGMTVGVMASEFNLPESKRINLVEVKKSYS
jgi:hypothetical protein